MHGAVPRARFGKAGTRVAAKSTGGSGTVAREVASKDMQQYGGKTIADYGEVYRRAWRG